MIFRFDIGFMATQSHAGAIADGEGEAESNELQHFSYLVFHVPMVLTQANMIA